MWWIRSILYDDEGFLLYMQSDSASPINGRRDYSPNAGSGRCLQMDYIRTCWRLSVDSCLFPSSWSLQYFTLRPSATAMGEPIMKESLFCTILNSEGLKLPPPSPEQSNLFRDFLDVTLEREREYGPLRILVRVHKYAAGGGQGTSILHLDWAGGGFVSGMLLQKFRANAYR